MKRRSSAADAEVSLFPFLAVLLCTMGTLAMIFAIASQNVAPDGNAVATLDGESTASSERAERSDGLDAAKTEEAKLADALEQIGDAPLEELEAEIESIAWFSDELNGVKTRTQAALEKERDRLAAAEKSLADLRSDASVAKKRLETLRSETIADEEENALALQEKIDALDAEIERLQTETKKLRKKNADAKRSYAILPYQGKKGVFRRPIYVECNERGVFLQPEGVPFLSTDFLLARYPGNPFDAGLRAAARRYVELSGEKTADGETVEPYPLLIIRPGGASRYYSAVAALASWGGDFGYEFVADDQEIAYPEPDAVLADAVREQTEFSRRRLAVQLAALMSARQASTSFAGASRFNASGSKGGASFAGSGNGSNGNGGAPASALQTRLGSQVKLGGVGGLGGFGSNASGGAVAGDASRQGGAIPVGVSGPLDDALALGSPNATGTKIDDGGDASGATLPRYSGDFARFIRPAPTASNAETASFAQNALNAQNIQNAEPSPTAQPADAATLAESTQGARLAIPNAVAQTSQTIPTPSSPQNAETAQGSPSSQTPQNASTPFLAQLQGTPQNAQNAQSSSAPKIDARQTLGNTTFGAGATGSSAFGTLADSGSGATSTRVEATEPKKPASDRPSARENPNAIRLSDELRRPSQQGLERGIRVLCSADALVFPKQPGLRAATSVSFDADAPLADVERELADAIVFCVKSWGVAGRNMYWAPFLKVEVASNGEERFRELSEFCRTQGLTVVRDDRGD
ncbi:MAG: hypothetical protein J6K20_02350 [Thermoguttaceae bacterium]|nr:hypothetical protein [Thermoguttaceae bacterium]